MLTGYLSGVSTLAPFLTLPDELLYQRPAPDSWSAAEVIHHLADAELANSALFRRIIVGARPRVEHWDADEYCEVLCYAERPLMHSVGTITALRHANVDLLSVVATDRWRLTATHPEQGPMTLKEVVLMSTQYMADRLAQARRAVNGAV